MSLSLFGPRVVDGDVAVNGLTAEKLEGFKAKGRATLVAGAVTVVPGPAVAATDLVELIEGDGAAGVEAARFLDTVTPGIAGVGSFVITSGNAGDIAPIGWIQYDNTWVG